MAIKIEMASLMALHFQKFLRANFKQKYRYCLTLLLTEIPKVAKAGCKQLKEQSRNGPQALLLP